MSCTGYSPLVKTVLQPAIGDKPPINGVVKIHIKQILTDGTLLSDSMVKSPTGTLIDLTNTKVLSSLIDELLVMVPGEISQFECSDMASGLFSVDLPPGQNLILEVEMLDWYGEDISEDKDNSLVKIITDEGNSRGKPCWTGKCRVGLTREGGPEEDILFRLGDGTSYNVPYPVEQTVLTMTRNETCTLTTPDTSYIIRLLAFEKEKALYVMGTAEVLSASLDLKSRGNTAYQCNKLYLARLYYDRCILYCESIVKSEQTDQFVDLLRSCHLNLAQVYLKQENFPKTVSHATTVLWTDPDNVKALYRRAFGQQKLGFLEEAQKDLEHVLSLDPGNIPAKSLLAIVVTQIQAKEDAEKQKMRAIFQKIEAENKELEAKESPRKSVWEEAFETCPEELATQDAYDVYKGHLEAELKLRKAEEAQKRAEYEAANPPKKKKKKKKKKKPAPSEVAITESVEITPDEKPVVEEPKDIDDFKYTVTHEKTFVNKIEDVLDNKVQDNGNLAAAGNDQEKTTDKETKEVVKETIDKVISLNTPDKETNVAIENGDTEEVIVNGEVVVEDIKVEL